jgi:hypothetical protein
MEGFSNVEYSDKLTLTIGVNTGGANKTVMELQRRLRLVSRDLMRVGMSSLFLGMSIQRYSQNIITGLLNSFTTVEGQNSRIVNQLDELKALWWYLRYDLMSSFVESGAADIVLGLIEKVMTKFTELEDKTKVKIVAGTLLAFLVGVTLIAVGQIITAINVIIASLGLLIPLLKKKVWVEGIDALITNMKWIAANPIKSLFGVGALIGIIFMGLFIKNMIKDLDMDWADFLKSIMRGLMRTLFIMGSAVNSILGAAFGKVFNFVISKVVDLINFVNKIPGVNISVDGLERFAYDKRSFGDIFKDVYTKQMTTGESFIDSILGPQAISLSPEEIMQSLINSARKSAEQMSFGLFGGGGAQPSTTETPPITNITNINVSGSVITQSELYRIWEENTNASFAGSSGQ